jgi:hypothetical protein
MNQYSGAYKLPHADVQDCPISLRLSHNPYVRFLRSARYDTGVSDGFDRMAAKNYTVNEILEQMAKIGLTRNAIEQYAEVIDRERFLWEERLGATSALTSQLNGLVHFLLDRLLLLMISEDGPDNESWISSELESYVHAHLDDVALSHEFLYASTHAIRDSLRPIDAGTEIST